MTSMHAKLRSVAASNNRVHMSWSLLLLVRGTYTWSCSLRISRSWWTAHSAQCQRRGCNTIKLIIINLN